MGVTVEGLGPIEHLRKRRRVLGSLSGERERACRVLLGVDRELHYFLKIAGQSRSSFSS